MIIFGSSKSSNRLLKDTDGSRTAYTDFLALWKDADSDIPILTKPRPSTRTCWETSELRSAISSETSMTPERWQQIREVLEKALQLAPGERSAF
jgi:hypothetical protein